MVDYSFERPIEARQLQSLFRQTHWAKDRSIKGIQTMLEGTAIVLGAWEDSHLVGFARTITDGAYRGLIDDVVVEDSRRGQGIGTELMQRLIGRLTEIGIEEVFLRCERDKVTFYQRHGFKIARVTVMDLAQP